MATTLKEKMGALTPERRARIDAETDRLHDEYKIFRELNHLRERSAVLS